MTRSTGKEKTYQSKTFAKNLLRAIKQPFDITEIFINNYIFISISTYESSLKIGTIVNYRRRS